MLSSLRWRLVVGTVLGTLAVYALAALILYSAIRQSLLSEFDASLETSARALMLMTEQDHEDIKLELDPTQKNVFGSAEKEERFVLLRHDETVVLRSDASVPGEWWATLPSQKGTIAAGHFKLPNGHHARFVAMHFVPRWEDDGQPTPHPNQLQPATLLLTGSAAEVFAKLRDLAWLLAVTFGLTTLISAVVMAWVIRRGLRPLGDLARSIQHIGNDDLSRRVEAGSAFLETRPVVVRLNELLARLEASFTRERAFTADVAHELRTPLAGLTTALEVTASRRRDPAEYESVLTQCLAVTRSMGGMVENLLTLARADAKQINTQRQPVDLAAALRRACRPFDSRAAARRLDIHWKLQPDLLSLTDAGLLESILSNLFDNAVSYCNEGGAITIDSRTADRLAQVRFTNTGSDVAHDQAERVFERFWRGDTARTQTGLHCGLGLALCQRIVTLLGGSIRVATSDGGDFVVTLLLPRP